MNIKTKPTTYKGILFKTKLEASYAKLFDEYNIKWQYEPKTFHFGNTGYGDAEHEIYYTPDFLLNNKQYVEIKSDRDEGLNVRAKERFFMNYIDEELIFMDSFWPLAEPKTCYKFHKPYRKHDGYSEYFSDCGVETINFKEFIEYVKLLGDKND